MTSTYHWPHCPLHAKPSRHRGRTHQSRPLVAPGDLRQRTREAHAAPAADVLGRMRLPWSRRPTPHGIVSRSLPPTRTLGCASRRSGADCRATPAARRHCRQSQSAALWACCPRVPAQRWAACPFLGTWLHHLDYPGTAPAPLVPGLLRGGPLPLAPGVSRAAFPSPDNVSSISDRMFTG
jgi:hypothetical protein